MIFSTLVVETGLNQRVASRLETREIETCKCERKDTKKQENFIAMNKGSFLVSIEFTQLQVDIFT